MLSLLSGCKVWLIDYTGVNRGSNGSDERNIETAEAGGGALAWAKPIRLWRILPWAKDSQLLKTCCF